MACADTAVDNEVGNAAMRPQALRNRQSQLLEVLISSYFHRFSRMEVSHRHLIAVLLLCSFATGCGLNSSILQKGGNGRKGVLLNYSCGAHPCDAIDPSKPTIVITHGWNPLPNKIHTTFGSSGARAIQRRCGDRYNLLSWDWNAVRVSPFKHAPITIGRSQGRMLATALRARGVSPQNTHMIAHSMGTIAIAQAAVCMSDLGAMAQLTLLDPPTKFHEEIFCKLGATRHALVVENYWAPGISGLGRHVNYRGVHNYRVQGKHPVRGCVDLSLSNHVNTMLWYYGTMKCSSIPNGFQNSVLLGHCEQY